MDFSRAGTELPQALVRFLRVEVAALRQRTLPFFRPLLQHGRIGRLLRTEPSVAPRRARRRLTTRPATRETARRAMVIWLRAALLAHYRAGSERGQTWV